MSAYVVSPAHIDALVTLAVKGPAEHDYGWLNLGWTETRENGQLIAHRADYDTADELGAMLYAENIGNVTELYPGREMLPGRLTADDAPAYVWPMSGPVLSAVDGLKALDGFEYQCCDRPSWATSPTRAFCDFLRRALIAELPGYAEAAWAITYGARDLGRQIVAVAAAALRCRADDTDPRDWTDSDAMRRYVAVIKAARVWKVDARTVAGAVPDTADGRAWGYVVADALDYAAARLRGVPAGAHITTTETTARIRF